MYLYSSVFIVSYCTVSPAGLEVPPLGPKWDRWAKKIRCASDPPIPADFRLEDWMRTRVFFAHCNDSLSGAVSIME